MSINLRIILIVLWALSSDALYAQIPSNPIGSNPFSLKWKQINTEKVQVIFPAGTDSTAQRVANIAHYLWDQDQVSIGSKNEKVSILLHTLRVNPNGFVIVGPFRSEFFNIPEQFKNPTSYADQLAIHEYRHVQQFANSDRGITAFARNILGSWIWGGFAATAWPRWYWEGDAVIAETIQSKGGRGRFPAFNMEYHALLYRGIINNYEKAAAGSLKDYVPDWYNLGYNVLSYGREKYGADLWKKVANDAVTYKGLFYPFAKSLKQYTGLSQQELYKNTMDHLQEKWAEIDQFRDDRGVLVNRDEKSTVIHYNSPIAISEKQTIALKSGYNQLNALITIYEDGTEFHLAEIGILPDRQETVLQYHDGKIVWSEQGFHHRWQNETYAELFIYDLPSRKKKRLTEHTRYSSPAFSPDGSRIVVVSIDRTLNQSIIEIDAENGNVLKTLYKSQGGELSFPRYYSDNEVVFIETKNQLNSIYSLTLDAGTYQSLMEPTSLHIGHLNTCDGQIVFSMADLYTHQIYSLDKATGIATQLTNNVLGAYQPHFFKDKIYYSEFDQQGYNIKKETLDRNNISTRAPERSPAAIPFYSELSNSQEAGLLDQIPSEEFEIKNYSRFTGILDFHTLLPQWNDPSFDLSLLSDNTFGTLSGNITGSYNFNEDEFQYGAGFRYAELYPIFSVDYRRVNRSSVFYQFTRPVDTAVVQSVFIERWNENRGTVGATIPYVFSSGNYGKQISFSARYQHTSTSLKDRSDNSLIAQDTLTASTNQLNQLNGLIQPTVSNDVIHTVDLGLNISILKFRARQHLRPRTGISFNARYRAPLGKAELGGNNLTARSFIYLPGFSRNHSLSFEAMYMQEDLLSGYRYSDLFVYPRGYEFSLRRDNYLKVGVNYRFPIIYPDLALGGFAFVKRLKGNIFFDYGRFGINSFPFRTNYNQLSSVGFELGVDVRALRLLEIDFGIRYSYLLNADFVGQNANQFDFFVISISE